MNLSQLLEKMAPCTISFLLVPVCRASYTYEEEISSVNLAFSSLLFCTIFWHLLVDSSDHWSVSHSDKVN